MMIIHHSQPPPLNRTYFSEGLKTKCMALKNGNAAANGGAGENGKSNGTTNGEGAGAGAGAGAGGRMGADFFANMTTCMLTQGAPTNRIDTDTHLRLVVIAIYILTCKW